MALNKRKRDLLISQGFGIVNIENFVNILQWADSRGIEVDDLVEYLDELREGNRQQEIELQKELQGKGKFFKELVPPLPLPITTRYRPMTCPECSCLMILENVNTSIRNRTGDISKCVHSCINSDCFHQIYYEESLSVVRERLKVPRKKKFFETKRKRRNIFKHKKEKE